MKKILQILIMSLLCGNTSFADDIRNIKIDEMSIGDSALEYFTEDQIENGEQGWYNYNYNEYSTSFLPGKKNYHLLEISYKSEDDKFVIEGITGILEKRIYDSYYQSFFKKECNKKLDALTLDISKLFENTKRSRKKTHQNSKDKLKKNTITSVSFNFLDKGQIILRCYYMDKVAKQSDSFRIDVRSGAFVNYLKKTD